MENGAGFAMHQTIGSHHLASKSLRDCLMTKTDAKERNFTGKPLNCGHRNPRFFWCTRPGRNYQSLRCQLCNIVQSQFIISDHFDLFAKFKKILNQVVGKGVVIVDHQ